MNKKFSTLAVAAMLASAFTAYAGPGDVVTQLAKGNNGKQYQLRATVNGADMGYLTLTGHDDVLKLTPAASLAEIGESLWCVDVTLENQGKNPIFDFTNKAYGSLLDVTVGGWNTTDWASRSGYKLDQKEAHVGGEVSGWEFTPVLGSTTVPMFGVTGDANANLSGATVYSLKSYISSTHVAVLVYENNEIRVAVAPADDIASVSNQIQFVLQEAYPVNLTAEQFNTILNTQKASEKVKMTFNKDYNNTEVVNPFSTNEFNAENVNSTWNASDPFVRLYKKDAAEKKSYLRVDTAYVNGFGTKFLGFAFKEADANNDFDEANLELAKQYQFRLNYCPTDDSLSIQVKQALYKVNDNNHWWNEGLVASPSTAEFYTIDWKDQVAVDGTPLADVVTGGNRNWVKLQDLELSTESRIVTIGDSPINTHISFGYGNCAEVASEFTSVADGVYYIKNDKGQYLAHPIYNNGESKPLFVTVNADEQDVAHMPAYQWVVLKKYTNTAASKATSPIMIANREFDTEFEYGGVQLKEADGAKYMHTSGDVKSLTKYYWEDEKDVKHFYTILTSADSLKFEAVPATSVKDQYLGYKKIEKDSLLVNKYTFNYWHPYADDKFIAKSDKDSTLTVLNGEDKAFEISFARTYEDEKAWPDQNNVYRLRKSSIDIKYGFARDGKVEVNGKDLTVKDIQSRIPGLAQLVRSAYLVNLNGEEWKVNKGDQFNVGENYDQQKSSYPVFFKENNHINGKHYYALLNTYSVFVDGTGDGTEDSPILEEYVVWDHKAGVSDYDGAATLKNQVLAETRTSAFAIERDNTPLYRRFNSAALEGQAGDGVDTLRFYEKYRNEYLMIEANPNFMVEHIDFLGIDAQDKAQGGLAFIVDTAWVNRGAGNIKPQYLISIDRHDLAATPGVPCTYEHNHYDNQGNAVDAAHCSHAIPATSGFARGKYLINFHNLAVYDNWANDLGGLEKSAYRWNRYDRAGFKEAIVYNDTLWILRDEFKNLKNEEIDFEALRKAENEALNKWVKEKENVYGSVAKAAAAYPSYIYDLTGDNHKYATWSMRFFDPSVAANEVEADRAFLIESMKSLTDYGDGEGDIEPYWAAWLKMQNGCLVLADSYYSSFEETVTGGDDALIFNVEHVCGDKVAVDNENIAVEGVSVVAGNGQVTIMGAAGKNVTITNILGKVIASQVIASDNATIAVPAGIVAVAVEGEAAVKAIVK